MLIYRQRFNLIVQSLPIAIPVELSINRIVIGAEVKDAKSTWVRAGYLKRRFLLPAIGFAKDENKNIDIGKTLIEFEDFGKYLIEFYPVRWINNVELTVFSMPETIDDRPTEFSEDDYLLGII